MRKLALSLLLLLGLSSSAFADNLKIYDEGIPKGVTVKELNCLGTGIDCTVSGIKGTITITGGVAGSTQQVQFNDAGVIAANPQFLFNKDSGALSVPTLNLTGTANRITFNLYGEYIDGDDAGDGYLSFASAGGVNNRILKMLLDSTHVRLSSDSGRIEAYSSTTKPFDVIREDSNLSSVQETFSITHSVDGVAANNIGIAFDYYTEVADGGINRVFRSAPAWLDATVKNSELREFLVSAGSLGGGSASWVRRYDGLMGFGSSSTPTAVADLFGQSTTKPALRLRSGTVTSSAASGYVENDGTNLHYTDSTPTRWKLARVTGTPTGGNCVKWNANGSIEDAGSACGSGGGGSVGGSDTHVQFNDGGAFGGDAGFTYNKTTDTATINAIAFSGATQRITGSNGEYVDLATDDLVKLGGSGGGSDRVLTINLDGTNLTISADSGVMQFTRTGGIVSEIIRDDSSTNTAIQVARLIRNTSGTAANGLGLMLDFVAENDAGSNVLQYRIAPEWSDVVAATEDATINEIIMSGGTATTKWKRLSSGRMFFNGSTSPTAIIHIAAGSASASSAPIKLTTGTLMTTPEAGAIEYNTPDLYYTDGTATRRRIGTTSGTLTNGNCAKFDASGNLVDHGATCGGAAYTTIQEEGSGLTARSTLNFIGSAATAADNGGASKTEVTFDSDLNGIADLSANGVVARTGTGTFSSRTITGTANEISISNGDGVSGNPTLSLSSTFDISGKTSTKPIKTGTSAPGTCAVGEYFFDTDATAGQNTYACTATNTWTLQGDAGGAGNAPIDGTYIVQTSNATLTNEQILADLATGYVKVTTSTGVLTSQAVPIPVADGGTGLTSGFTMSNSSNITTIAAISTNALTLRADATTNDSITIDTSGRLCIGSGGSTGITCDKRINMSGSAAQTVGLVRHGTANTAGNNFTLLAGGATSGATDKNGGDLILSAGTATGDGESKVIVQTVNTSQGSGTTDRSPATVWQWDEGHIETLGTAPTINTGFGTSPSILGTDVAGQVTVGTGGTATTGTIDFAKAWTNVPMCFSNHEGAILGTRAVASTTQLTIDAATPFSASGKIDYFCVGRE